MSNFNCEHCGAACIDSPRGYVTGCEHYPAEGTTMKTATKEKPILFSGAMVKAILAGRKTVTRRVIKPQPPQCSKDWEWIVTMGDGGAALFEAMLPAKCSTFDEPPEPDQYEPWQTLYCPYGAVGSRLWVRESFRIGSFGAGTAQIFYDADAAPAIVSDRKLPNRLGAVPSIHMPRHCSRINLEIVSVRAERLHEITEADAQAEGFEQEHIHGGMYETAYSKFSTLWDTLNEKRGFPFDSNPWVWRVEFRRVP